MRNIALILLLSAMLFGCVQQNQNNQSQHYLDNQTDEYSDEYYYDNESDVLGLDTYLFFYAGYLPPATVGVPYNYSFCDPAPTNVNDLCGGLEDASNPSGGHNPYHFTLGSGVGFQPFGLILNLNGLLTGTPTMAGEREFEVCAVDLDGNQECDDVTLTVNEPKEPLLLNIHFKGSGSGQVFIDGITNDPIVCDSDCVINVTEEYTSLNVIFAPGLASAFGGWSGDCSYYSCSLFMTNESKDITAEFDTFEFTASATCSSTGDSSYSNRVEIRGTATGPKGAHIVIDDTKGYNGFMDMTDDCGSWAEGSIGCVNKGEASSTTWSSGFRMASPTYSNPFVWTPIYSLTVAYGSSYGESDQILASTITVPVVVRCP